MGRWQEVAELAGRQHGVVSRNQLIAIGVSEATSSRLLARGWVRLHPGVYRAPATAATFAQRVQAAQLALGAPSVATAATAAHLYRLRPPPETLTLLVDEDERAKPPAGVRLRRTRTLVPSDITDVSGLQVATACRMILDFAAFAPPPEVRALIIDARQRRLVELEMIERRLGSLGPVPGRGVARRLVWELSPVRCDSVLEDLTRRQLRDAGVPPPHPEPVPVHTGGRTFHVDIGWPEAKVGIEVDGFAYHSSRSDLERDHRRANALALAGWIILRVGWERLERDPAAFTDEVGRLLVKVWSDRAHM